MEKKSKNDQNNDFDSSEYIPQSGPNLIVIPANIKSCKFYQEAYSEEYLGDIIPKEDFDHIINECSKIMINCWVINKSNEKVKSPNHIKILSLISWISVLVYIGLMISGLFASNYSLFFFTGLMTLIGSTTSILLYAIMNHLRQINKGKSFKELLKSYLDAYYKQINSKFLGYLHFNFVPNGYYIECNILKKFDKANDEEIIKEKKRKQFLNFNDEEKKIDLEKTEKKETKKNTQNLKKIKTENFLTDGKNSIKERDSKKLNTKEDSMNKKQNLVRDKNI